MLDIILAFFAVIGIGLLGSRIFDALYFRKYRYDLHFIVDLKNADLETAWNTLESISVARKTPGGKWLTADLTVLVSGVESRVTEEMVYHYLRIFDLPGTVFTEGEDWFSQFQNTPEKEGTNPS